MRRFDRVVIVATVAAALAAIPLASSVAASAPTGGVINIDLDAAPDVAPDVSPRLLLDGTDVTDTYCVPGGEAYGAQITCPGLPDGDYVIDVDGVSDGLRSAVNCTDIVAAQAIEPTIGRGFTDWVCQVFVGAPAVVLTVNASVGDEPPDDVRFALAPVEGVDVECVDDVAAGTAALRCRNLVPGDYELALSGVPTTFVASEPFCQTAFFTPEQAHDVGSIPAITDEQWLWRCDVDVVPRAVIEVQTLSADLVLPEADRLGLSVTGPEGDVTSRCPVTHGSRTHSWTFSCELETGSYAVAFSGLPDVTIDRSCESFELTADQVGQVACYWGLVLGTGDTVATTSPSTRPTTVDELPVTGPSPTTVPIAATLLLAGAALVGLARRRTDA